MERKTGVDFLRMFLMFFGAHPPYFGQRRGAGQHSVDVQPVPGGVAAGDGGPVRGRLLCPHQWLCGEHCKVSLVPGGEPVAGDRLLHPADYCSVRGLDAGSGVQTDLVRGHLPHHQQSVLVHDGVCGDVFLHPPDEFGAREGEQTDADGVFGGGPGGVLLPALSVYHPAARLPLRPAPGLQYGVADYAVPDGGIFEKV